MTKDRQNWLGKTPKRTLVFGNLSDFDWAAESQRIARLKENNLRRSLSSSSSSSAGSNIVRMGTLIESQENPGAIVGAAAPPDVVSPPAATPPNVETADTTPAPATHQGSCRVCRIVVWLGPASSCPVGLSLAYPLDQQWECVCDNFEPHCKKCWDEEQKILDKLSGEHCATGAVKGGSKKKVAKKKVAKKKVVKKKVVKKKTTKKSTKKKAMSQSQKDKIIIESHNESIASAAAAVAAAAAPSGVAIVKKTIVKKTVANKTVANKQLGGVQGPIETALEEAQVEEEETPPATPETPWEVRVFGCLSHIHWCFSTPPSYNMEINFTPPLRLDNPLMPNTKTGGFIRHLSRP